MVISIITPVYKVEAYLSRCVDSILNQSFQDFELILVDDGSPDQSGLICDRFAEEDNRIRVIHQVNGGAAAARNAGLDAASGDWITFVDSDDWVHPDYLRLLFETACLNDADVSVCTYQTVSDQTGGFIIEEARLSFDTKESYWIQDRTGATVPWGKLYRSELFRELRYPVGRTAEDEYVTYTILFACRRLAVLDNKLYFYFVNKDSVSRSDYLKRFPDALEAFRQHEEYFAHSPWQKAYRLESEYYASAWSEAIWLLKTRKDEESRRMMKKLRRELKEYMRTHKRYIPLEKRKDIYISAYPEHEWLIRGFGFLKGKLKHE